MTKLFCSQTNQAVTLTVSIAQSGEGEVWRTDRPGLLAKIYHVPASHEKEKLAQMKDRVAKLEVMVKRVPKDPNAHQNHISFAWPRSLLKNSGGEVVGFLMPEVENSLDLLKVCTPRMRKSLGVDANWYFLHVVARNIAGIIQAIHDEGYVLGDIKLQNILVNNRALPTIIDTDSFQVVDPVQNKVYRCLVASEGFTPSELIGKNIDSITQSAVHDRFRLGVVIYYLLFGGPPFRGSWQGSGDPPEQVELIRRGYWPYAPNSLIQPNHNTIPLDIIHPELQRCFLLCFNEGHFNPSKRPSARVWLDALEVAFNELQSCGKVDSHFYGLSYGRCYWCDRANNLGIDIFLGNPVTKAIQTSSFQNTNQQKIVVKFANSKNISQTTQGKSQHKQVLIKKGNLKSKWLWGSFTSFLIICSGILVWFFYFKQSDDRVSILASIAKRYTEINQFDKALNIANQIQDDSDKTRILREIVERYAEINQFDKALNIANQIQDDSDKTRILREIVKRYAEINQFDKALNIANQIQDNFDKVNALGEIAKRYTEINQFSKSERVLNQALNIAKQIQDNSDKIWVLIEIAKRYTEIKQFDKSETVLNQALNIANQIQDNSDKVNALENISKRYTEIDQFGKSERVLNQALNIANQIQDNSDKVNVLGEIAKRYAEINQFDKVLHIVNQIQDNQNSFDRTRTLGEIAKRYAEINQFDKALNIANQIKNDADKGEALKNIVKRYTEINQLDKALKIANKIQDNFHKGEALENIVKRHTEINQFDEALNIVEQIKDNDFYGLYNFYYLSTFKINALGEIAKRYAEINQLDKSEKILNQALSIANQIQDNFNNYKSEALGNIAKRYAEINQLDKSEKILNQALSIIQYDSSKIWILSDIAKKYAKINQFGKSERLLNQALNIANQIQDNPDKVWVLREIAERYAEINQFDKALNIANQI